MRRRIRNTASENWTARHRRPLGNIRNMDSVSAAALKLWKKLDPELWKKSKKKK